MQKIVSLTIAVNVEKCLDIRFKGFFICKNTVLKRRLVRLLPVAMVTQIAFFKFPLFALVLFTKNLWKPRQILQPSCPAIAT